MAVILEERGRGKFKPAPEYNVLHLHYTLVNLSLHQSIM